MTTTKCERCNKTVTLPRGSSRYCSECEYKIREEIDEITRPRRKVQRARKAKAE